MMRNFKIVDRLMKSHKESDNHMACLSLVFNLYFISIGFSIIGL